MAPITAAEFRAWRERRGWSQTEAAEALGLPQPRISEMENGRRRVRPQTQRLIEALDREQECLEILQRGGGQ